MKLLTAAFRNYRFTPDGVVVPLNGPKVMPQVEEMLVVLEKALEHGKKPKASNGSNGNGASGNGSSARPKRTRFLKKVWAWDKYLPAISVTMKLRTPL